MKTRRLSFSTLSKVKKRIINNLPLILSLTILSLSLFYNYNQLGYKSAQLSRENNYAVQDFSVQLRTDIINQINIVQKLMMNQWLNVQNEAELYNYSRFLQIVPSFYNYSSSFLAINWINSSGVISWVYPYARNKAALGYNVTLYQKKNGGGPNLAYFVAKDNHTVGFTKFANLVQGGSGYVAYIPIIYQNVTTGYFNVAFDITHILSSIIAHELSLSDFSFRIYENQTVVSHLNGNFSLKDSFVDNSTVYFYNKELIIYSHPLASLIFDTSPLSILNIFIAEIFLCLLTYFLINELEKKNGIIEEEYKEKEKMLNVVNRTKRFEALGTLAGGIAHDFNNIMTNIKGHLEIIKSDVPVIKKEIGQDELFTEIDYSLSAIDKNLARSKDITGQILAFSRQSSANLEILDTQQIIQESIKLVRETADKRIKFTFYNTDSYYVLANQTQLLQVVMNVLINSVNAVNNFENASIEVHCTLCNEKYNSLLLDKIKKVGPETEFDSYGIKITVRDNGKGMDSTQVENAFDPFYSPKVTGKGTGLGLGIVYNNVVALGGDVDLKSELHKYTEVIITLPQVKKSSFQPKQDQKRKENALTDLNDRNLTGKKICLVDDEVDIIVAYSKILRDNGAEVKTCSNGKEAWDYYQKNKNNFDLIILDINLPELSGSKIVELIRGLNPDQKIIVISGYFEDQINYSNVDILQKPFDIDRFLAVIRKQLQ